MSEAWIIVFPGPRAVEHAPWWARLLAPGYRHVLACRPAGEGRTLLVEQRGTHLAVEVLPMPAGAFVRGLLDAAQGWALLAEAAPGPARPRLRGPLTCVEACKALLGLRAPFVLTPRQLARFLRRRGAKPVLPVPGD